ncbi:hypothetical protein LEMLEM_LOCUS19930, partial [Lemmus lemmus]
SSCRDIIFKKLLCSVFPKASEGGISQETGQLLVTKQEESTVQHLLKPPCCAPKVGLSPHIVTTEFQRP